MNGRGLYRSLAKYINVDLLGSDGNIWSFFYLEEAWRLRNVTVNIAGKTSSMAKERGCTIRRTMVVGSAQFVKKSIHKIVGRII